MSEDYQDNDFEDVLPKEWKYSIINKIIYGVGEDLGKTEITMKVALFSAMDIEMWIGSLEQRTSCIYLIQETREHSSQHFKFKQLLCCHHNIISDEKDVASIKNNSKNRNCPSSLNIMLQAVEYTSPENVEDAPDPEMPCIITFRPIHIHSTSSDYISSCVLTNAKQKLLDLFEQGHTIDTACIALKFELLLTSDDYEKSIADRGIYPDYNYCYNLFIKENKNQRCLGSTMVDENNSLEEVLKRYNDLQGEECAKMQIMESGYVITLCPLLFKQIHKNIPASSKIVYLSSVDYFKGQDRRLFILSTKSECGELPLGLIMTSSSSPDHIQTGLEMLKIILGETMFNGKIDGPCIIMADNYEATHIAIKESWPKSRYLLSIGSVKETMFRWLIDSKHRIPIHIVIQFFEQFQAVMHAPTVEQCEKEYQGAMEAGSIYPNYVSYLKTYWRLRYMWAIAFRKGLPLDMDHTSNISDAAMCLLKHKIFSQLTDFNSIQLLNFLLTNYVDYYKYRLLSTASNSITTKEKLLFTTRLPNENIIGNIKKIRDNMYLVPCENTQHVQYIVYTDSLVCTCFTGNENRTCKHIEWIHILYHRQAYHRRTDDMTIRNIFHKIATNGMLFPAEHHLHIESQNNKPLAADDEYNKTPLPTDYEMSEASSDLNGENSDEDPDIQEGLDLIAHISDCFAQFVYMTPSRCVPALREMLQSLKTLNSVDEFVSSCTAFASDEIPF